eukprot:CAMPEP_0118644960 /NCGR_PEP_ID=MMETSP0785-20121206/7237_1 /TAXON_ID=91992 /ORGANISM="Bolidomonas pacifica, Strain CCMP 1866" /LENGTH=478 /DNA_ID=CAMNT_0006536793 /DNA_START=131 /DNA_END=1563 /DNA_ORIENTATION=+
MTYLLITLLLLITPTTLTFKYRAHRPTLPNQISTPLMTKRLHSTPPNKNWVNPCAPVSTPDSLTLTLQKSLQGSTFKKNLSILGSTGSIGTQTLDIVRAKPDNFKVTSLSAGRNLDLLVEQIVEFQPDIVSVMDVEDIKKLEGMLKGKFKPSKIVGGPSGIIEVSRDPSSDTLVTGIVGSAGLQPTVEGIKHGKDIALANKETLIAGGPVVVPMVEEYGVNMLPADSEHSAVFQSLQGCPPGGLSKVILTASGGAFRDFSKEELFDLCESDPSAVLAKATTHPNWDMGAKITLDSATMCNKGLEVIEAHYLFGAGYDDIDVVVHPQSIVHSMVEMRDTSVVAQLGWADMRLPLVYALSWPHRLEMDYRRLNLAEIGSLTFKEPDQGKYPCIGLCYEAGRAGGTMTSVLNAANEMANEIYRKDVGMGFLDIPRLIEGAMEGAREQGLYKTVGVELNDILESDQWARDWVGRKVEEGLGG